jgi:hypothetical protein
MYQTPARRQPPSRDDMPRIGISCDGKRFYVTIDGCAIRECADELDAHHWGKHAFEAVHDGLVSPADERRGVAELCRQATAFNLHN